MQTANHSIQTRSHRIAMDWSLVLASQDIEHTIESTDEAWLLVISDVDVERAAAAIRAYEQENATVWRHEVKWTGLLFDWRSVFWWVFVVFMFLLSTGSRPELREQGVFNSVRFLHGEWWRAVTAVTLHADAAHIALNTATGLLLLGLVMGCFGAGRGLLVSLLCGAGANAIEAGLQPKGYNGLGASGMVMASLGLLAAQSMFERHTSAREWIGRGVIAAFLLFTLIGFDVKSDILAHLLGFVNGMVCGVGICLVDRQLKGRPAIDLAAAIFAAALVGTSWALAIRAG